ncbi:MAG: hypothetical protein JNM00_06290, partial [Flavobacteriales bacterium]|nr:hypothetical protein [Flavobacteriales bacterium]
MRRTQFYGFIGLFFLGAVLAACLNEDNKIPPNCYDGILNNGEFLIDCGGLNCPECNHCINGIFENWLGETCLDCGGECGECDVCNNCVQDGDEFGIDCGGTFCGPCEELCDDGILNGTEEGVDCGGEFCEPCPSCIDDMMNGTEIGIDCGGTSCPPCATPGNCSNTILDGEELWVDCGANVTGYCPGCDTLYTWKAGGTTHECSADDIIFTFDGTDLTVIGTSLQGGMFTLIANDPPAGWEEDLELTFNPAMQPDFVLTFLDVDGTT